ncbi:hypothetical protein [Demequina iriomotensis]|uniref:hypothetical protein n=1 Tax=Demequina iriomotensis TaxID=1536641 RepID=UPI000A82EA4A|nr:hypothetical protein [Demequina iriomotensis]
MSAQIAVANALPAALDHYARELGQTLERIGVTDSLLGVSPVEGLDGFRGRARMLTNALANRSLRSRHGGPVLDLWPSLGLLEARSVSAPRSPQLLVLHDPVPLRRQVGFGPLVTRWAASAPSKKRPTIVVHSHAADRVVEELLPQHVRRFALHPVLSHEPIGAESLSNTVLIAGQFKPARDVELIAALGRLLPQHGLRGRIVGRGWPDLAGWEVENRFVPESELDELLASASAVVLPYSHYFQSGIAVRALENGTLTVGRRTDFLEVLVGRRSPSLVDSGTAHAYARAIVETVSLDRSGATQALGDFRRRVDESWNALLGELAGDYRA